MRHQTPGSRAAVYLYVVLLPGTRVEVRNHFKGTWSRGFTIEEADEGTGYLIRRRSDDELLPVRFQPEEVRRERKEGLWWY